MMIWGLRRGALAVAAMSVFAVQAGAVAIHNGNFEGGFEPAGPDDFCPVKWTMLETASGPGEQSVIKSIFDNGPILPGKCAAAWCRSSGGRTSDWTAIEQVFEPPIDVQTQSHFGLSLDIKAMSHDLGGGGYGPDRSDYPVTVVLYFTDTKGIERYWQHGFYIQSTDETGDPPRGEIVAGGTGIVFSTRVAQGEWVSSFFDLARDLRALAEPRLVTKIRVGGCGWNFQGQVDNLGFYARPLAVESKSWGAIKALYH